MFANVHATDGGGSCATQWWLIVVLQLLVVLLILGLFFAAMWSGYRCRKYVMRGPVEMTALRRQGSTRRRVVHFRDPPERPLTISAHMRARSVQ
ncbi:hypothetical protein niasHT_029404 [Heterodera trifolii]|uniref:Uncharacterized protein n=1 Tax=Heterodera trifolii TaxID=157864 RepID=A0ABD2KIW3_9BILA